MIKITDKSPLQHNECVGMIVKGKCEQEIGGGSGKDQINKTKKKGIELFRV